MSPTDDGSRRDRDETLRFAGEPAPLAGAGDGAWKVMVVDDEQAIHDLTRLVLRGYVFDSRPLDFLHAFSAAEARQLLRANPDTAIILLDVVMETDDAGLRLVRYIREELENRWLRIVLRTGQPGQAPEREVVAAYDINDYKSKTELTAQKLFTTVTAALRAYRDIRTIERGRLGVARVVTAAASLAAERSLKGCAEAVLRQFAALIGPCPLLAAGVDGFVARDNGGGDWRLLAASGRFAPATDGSLRDVVEPETWDWLLECAAAQRRGAFHERRFLGRFLGPRGEANLLYLETEQPFATVDRDLVQVYAETVAVALSNIDLHEEIAATQKDVILTLSEVVETRSKETAAHVLRVGEYARLFGDRLGLDAQRQETLRLAAPMHDVGKIGVPDAILQKPGRLDERERKIMREHARLGWEILRKSQRKLLQVAATAALQHHERWDGGGYPQGLKGEQIDLAGRITGIADVFDALCHRRIYKPALALDEVLQVVKEERARHFDPALADILLGDVEAFVAVQRAYPD